MSVIKKTSYQCSLCKEAYDTETKAEICFATFSKAQKKEEVEKKKAEDWFKEHPPLFKRGDLVRFKQNIDIEDLGFCNQLFIVLDVVKSTDIYYSGNPFWLYRGVTGEYDHEYCTSDDDETKLCDEDYLELYMTAAEYNKREDEIIKKAKAYFPDGTSFFVKHCNDTEEFKLSVYLPIKEKL